MKSPKRAAFHTLGCKVNQYETEALIERFREAGFVIAPEDEPADVYVINTCTVTNLADRKSRQYIRRARKTCPDAVIAVTGCYAQVKPEEAAAIEGVDIVCGTDRKGDLLRLVLEELAQGPRRAQTVEVLPLQDLTEYEELGRVTGRSGKTRAFLKIQDGCENFCTYCLIPYARGRVRSRRPEDVAAEAEGLVRSGCREIVLTGINTAYYGRASGRLAGPPGPGEGLEPLLRRLNDIPGDFRIRLSSLEPTLVDAAYVKKLLPFDRLCHHLHLALQSGSDRVLSAMRRRYTMRDYWDIVDVLRDFDPLYGISTDIIVGFPGETDEDFEQSVRAVTKAGFCKTHVFPYSPRTGTPAASMPQIPGDVKHARARRLIGEAARAAEDFRRQNIGSRRVVLTERTLQDPITGEDQGMESPGAARGEAGASDFVVGYTDNYIKTYIAGACPPNTLTGAVLTGLAEDGMTASRAE